jgi:Ca-activated chloride channel family protein
MNAIVNDMMTDAVFILNNLHFIRADWFYAFIPLIVFLLFALKRTGDSKNWRSVIDTKLLPFVLSSSSGKHRRYPLLLVLIAGSLCITALAGPVYKKLPQPVYREQSSLVVLLDLSQSMNATDIKPSRLSRAKLELLDILKTRKTGQTALVVYAADAFVVTPLTDDNATIANLIPSLETDMMPAQGSNLTAALAEASNLFTQAGIINGNILVITDGIHKRDAAAIKKIFSQGHRVSIFGIGTAEGAPIPVDGGFLHDSAGAIVVPRLTVERLQRYALSGGGLYTSLQAGDRDINKLAHLFESSKVDQSIANEETNADVWQEEGYWLLLPLLFFAALWARKGWLAVILLFVLPLPQPGYADTKIPDHPIIDTEYLWSSPDQKAMQAFNAGDHEKAASEFTRPDWKASAYYRKGDYEAAAKTLENASTSDEYYNRANALAKLGQYEEAIKAYDKALELDKNNADAKYNREQVKQALKEQQQQKNNSEQNDSDKKDSGQKDQQQENQQQANQQQGKQQDQQQQNNQQQDTQQKDSQQQGQQQQNQQQQDQQQQNNEQQSAGDNKDSEQDKEQNPADNAQDQNQDENKEAEEQQLKQRDAAAEKEKQQEEQRQYEQQQKEQKEKQDNAEQDNSTDSKEVENNKDSEEKPQEIEVNPVEASITEQEKATEQWLKRVPDDPGGLLRRKFLYQYKQIPNQNDDSEPW